jgi:hypothetical protein
MSIAIPRLGHAFDYRKSEHLGLNNPAPSTHPYQACSCPCVLSYRGNLGLLAVLPLCSSRLLCCSLALALLFSVRGFGLLPLLPLSSLSPLYLLAPCSPLIGPGPRGCSLLALLPLSSRLFGSSLPLALLFLPASCPPLLAPPPQVQGMLSAGD